MEKKSNFVSKFMTNIKEILPYHGQHLQNLPKNHLDHVLKYLDILDSSALFFSNKGINIKIKELNREMRYNNYYCDTKIDGLFYCVSLVMGSELDDTRVFSVLANKQCMDYLTDKKVTDLDYMDNSFKLRVLDDFANTFIKNKKDKDFFVSNMKLIVKTGFIDYSTAPECEELRKTFESTTNFYEAFFKACGFKLEDILSAKYIEKNNYKKQIQNYEKITGKSYKPIYNNLKNNPDPEKPERENYVKAYEEMRK